MVSSGSHNPALRTGLIPTEDPDHGLGHIAAPGTYEKVFFALLALTVITVAAAWLDLGVLTLTIAIGIATAKSALVGLYFMHLRWEGKMIWITALYPMFVFALLLGGTLGDYVEMRQPTPMNVPAAVRSLPTAKKFFTEDHGAESRGVQPPAAPAH